MLLHRTGIFLYFGRRIALENATLRCPFSFCDSKLKLIGKYCSFSRTLQRSITTSNILLEEEKSTSLYEVTFIKKNGERIKVKGKDGDSLLDVVVNNNLDLDGYGACEGTLTCSTCHVILKKTDYNKLPDEPSDEEMDMLDLAYELTETSRLGCQIMLCKDLDGLEVQLPSSINDARS